MIKFTFIFKTSRGMFFLVLDCQRSESSPRSNREGEGRSLGDFIKSGPSPGLGQGWAGARTEWGGRAGWVGSSPSCVRAWSPGNPQYQSDCPPSGDSQPCLPPGWWLLRPAVQSQRLPTLWRAPAVTIKITGGLFSLPPSLSSPLQWVVINISPASLTPCSREGSAWSLWCDVMVVWWCDGGVWW